MSTPERFNDLFDRWSSTYDETVAGGDAEYKEVFKHYDLILQTIADRAYGHVIEFGIGTGNLTKKLLANRLDVTGIEPSKKMREIALQKLPNANIAKGNFLNFPPISEKVDTIVSSYAFHHLTDDEKEQAIRLYATLLNKGGKIVFGDTFFKDKQVREQAYKHAKKQQKHRLAEDLNTEFYTTLPVMKSMLAAHHFSFTFDQMNDYVWIMEAVKEEDTNDDKLE